MKRHKHHMPLVHHFGKIKGRFLADDVADNLMAE
jgi:hypothetical protein